METARNSPPGSLGSPADAVASLATRVAVVQAERVPVERCVGRVLREPLRADRDSPPLDVSAMDGFALRSADIPSAPLPIVGDARIGEPPIELGPRTASRIVTGAPIPAGADAVLKREDAEEREGRVRPLVRVDHGAHVRRKGENARTGEIVVEPGRVITGTLAAALAAFGVARPSVARPVRVGVLVTGDEIVDPDASPAAWEIRDSNGPGVAGVLASRAWIDVVRSGHARDTMDALRARIGELVQTCDAVVLTGGVSMGPRDLVPDVLRELGVVAVFHRIAQRPGRPMLGAVTRDGRPVFGLPGNPASSLVTALRIVVPVLAVVAGVRSAASVPRVRLDAEDAPGPTGLWWHRLVRVGEDGVARPTHTAGSGDVAALARSDGFVEVPPGEEGPGPWPFYRWAVDP